MEGVRERLIDAAKTQMNRWGRRNGFGAVGTANFVTPLQQPHVRSNKNGRQKQKTDRLPDTQPFHIAPLVTKSLLPVW
jgi:hypothetical protein